MGAFDIPSGGNDRVRVTGVEVLSDDWYVLRKVTFAFRHRDGRSSVQSREAYDRGNGAGLLLYDPERGTVILTRQFRLPAYVNGHPDGELIEVPAGLLDERDAESAIRHEAEEEVGIRVGAMRRVFDVFMSPGSVTERLVLFAAPYSADARVERGRRPGGRGRGHRRHRVPPRGRDRDGRFGRDRQREDDHAPPVGSAERAWLRARLRATGGWCWASA